MSAFSSTTTTADPGLQHGRLDQTARPPRAFSAFRGKTELQSVYAQDSWRFADDWRATLGVRVERWQASDGAIVQCDEHADFRRTHRDARLAQGGARLATDPRLGAEGVGRTRRAHADGVRAVPGLDLGRRDREQRSRTSSPRNPGPASSPRSANSAMDCCEPRTSTKTRATRCIRRPTSPWFPTSPTSRTWITSAPAASSWPTRRSDVFVERPRPLGQPHLRALAHRRERQLSRERRQMAAARAGLARQRARDLALR